MSSGGARGLAAISGLMILSLALIGLISRADTTEAARGRAEDSGKLAQSSPASAPADLAVAVYEDSNPGRFREIFAMSDVHGMYIHLVQLLTAAKIVDQNLNWSGGSSLLIVVGDSVDKGPQSLEVIDLLMKLQSQAPSAGGQVIHLLGNHEAEFLANPKPKAKSVLVQEILSRGLKVEDLANDTQPRGHFLRTEPVAARIGDWFFAHSGHFQESSFAEFKTSAAAAWASQNYQNPFFIGDLSVLEIKDWWLSGGAERAAYESRLDAGGLAGVVFGHQPMALNIEGSIAQSEDHRLIKIDNGMAPAAGSHAGSLLVFTSPQQLVRANLAPGMQPDIKMLDASGKRSEVPLESQTRLLEAEED